MNKRQNELSVKENRNYKDTLFRMIFQDPKELLSLYNALNSTSYENPTDLKIVTLENAIYMNMKNDLACVIACHLNLYEHQSTVNPNMPLRDLLYVAREYEKLFADTTLYFARQVKIPTPTFIVFYNGSASQPDRLELKLSDAFEIPTDDPALELKVIQLNINHGHNISLMEKCRTLREYALYVERVRTYTKNKPLKEAVEQAVTECINEGILSGFLTRYKTEAISMSIFEYDEEREMKLIRQSERELGWEEGHADGTKEGFVAGMTVGKDEGKLEGIRAFITLCNELTFSEDEIVSQLMTKFELSASDSIAYIQKVEK